MAAASGGSEPHFSRGLHAPASPGVSTPQPHLLCRPGSDLLSSLLPASRRHGLPAPPERDRQKSLLPGARVPARAGG